VSFHAPDGELHGVLARAREIEELAGALEHARLELQALQREAEEAGARVEEAHSRQEALRARIEEDRQRLHALQLQALRLAQAHEEANRRGQQIEAELAEIATQAQAAEANRAAAERRSAEFESESASARTQLELATDLYERAEAVLRLQREALQKAREEAQSAAFSEKSCESKINEIQALLKVTSENIARSEAALAEREGELARCDETGLQQRLQEALAVRREREQALVGAREALESAAAALKALDEERQQCEQRLEPLRERIAEARLKEQEARLSEEGFARQLAEADAREEELEPQLEKGARAGTLQAEIVRLGEEVKALGAVNLAALEELEAARERKSFLDAQSRDLNEAMATLEDAIRRIDRETRERLQRTFDEVNARFAETFPALFGGGHAKLVLTGEEILDAGVQVSAQPPGKRTTTIHLLSGGEKALTALALVFALFQLNPAPFCLLDEVDAPLDDNNTERFCELVKQMSRQSQFIFISHNKITMEIAEQLLGITMQEPGVSRVVAVDIEEAMKLAEEAA
jgi:chromosome segregation protein